MALRVKHVMRKEVMTVAPSESLNVANRLMTFGDLRHLPVVIGPTVVGILTHGDILRAPSRLAPGRERGLDATTVLRGLRVQEAMTKPVVTIGPEASVNEAVEQLLRHRIQCLPVMAEGRLVGLFTEADLLCAIAWPRDGLSELRAPAPAASAAHSPPDRLSLEA